MAGPKPSFYEVFQQANHKWYFVIPEYDTPFPGDGDMLVGPYLDRTSAMLDCDSARVKAEA